MSDTEQVQDTKQATAPFRVGQQVRCVDVAFPLAANVVYTVTGVDDYKVWLDGSPVGNPYGWWYASRFVPAPEAKAEPVNWSKIALTPHEAEQLFAIHAAGSLGDGYLIDASLGASLRDKGLVSRDHQGNRPTVAGNNWVITAWLGRTNWKGLYEDARRELALVKQVLSGAGGVTGERGSEVLDLALGVVKERDSLRARVAELEAKPERKLALSVEGIASSIAAQCPEDEVVFVKVGPGRSITFRGTTESDVVAACAAIAGKEASNG